MKHILLSLIICCVASVAAAIDLGSIVNTLKADDYTAHTQAVARTQARQDLLAAFSLATGPGAAEASRLQLESGVVEQLRTAALPLSERLYLIRMLELFGTDAGADAAAALLRDSDPQVRDSARRALVAIPGAKAEAHLLSAFSNSSAADRAAYIDALATRGTAAAAPAIAALLQSSDPALQRSAAMALGKLGNDAVLPELLNARTTATATTKGLIESALVQIGADAATANDLASTAMSGAIRAAAFKQLIASDPQAANQVLEMVLSQADFPGRLLFLQVALESEVVPLRDRVVAHLPTASENDQIVIVTAIAEQQLAYEAPLLALLPSTEGILSTRIIDALGNVGSDASFEPLYQALTANSKDLTVANALARLKAPVADQKALASVAHGSDRAARIASIKVLELRNTSGAIAVLNRIISETTDAELKDAAFKALETIGDAESIQILLSHITREDAQAKAAQRSLKRLSINFGAPEYQWQSLYHPSLQAVGTDAARQAIIQILDGVACESVAAYLQQILLAHDLALRPAVISALQRWPLQAPLYEGGLWLSVASADYASDQERAQAVRALKKMLRYRSGNFFNSQADLLVMIVQAELPLADKRDLLSVYEDPAKHFGPAQWRRAEIAQRLQVVEDHPQVGDLIQQIISQL